MSIVYPDVSEQQGAVLDDTYTRPFVMFRLANEWGRIDYKLAQNLATAIRLRAAGKLVNFGVYIIPGLAPDATVYGNLDAVKLPTDCVVMLDCESWGRQVTGNHSTAWNALVDRIRARQSGRADLVWTYADAGDWGELWPSRPAWFVDGVNRGIANYSTHTPPPGSWAFWQYTDGQNNPTGNPSSTPPFGACDHNLLIAPIPTPEDDMTPDQAKQLAEIHEWVRRIDFGVDNGGGVPFTERGEIINRIRAIQAAVNPDQLAQKIAAYIPAGGASQADIEAAVRAVFADAAKA